jgi:hypothetical protein
MGSTAVFNQMRDIGMTWVKFQTQDTDIPGRIAAAKAAGLKVLIGAVGDRRRAADPNYHREFAASLVDLVRMGADAIEVWNEPNLDREYGGPGNGQVNPENYVNMLREAYTAIKAANPNVLVISGAMAPTGYFGGNCTNAGCDDAPFLRRMAAAGAAQWMDCIGAHHNGTMVGPDQTSGAPVGSSDHHQWYFWGTLNVTYDAFGGQRPVCWTELGYLTPEGLGSIQAPNFQWGANITLANQAQWLARAAQLSRDSGKVRMMIIWNMDRRQYDAESHCAVRWRWSWQRSDCAPTLSMLRSRSRSMGLPGCWRREAGVHCTLIAMTMKPGRIASAAHGSNEWWRGGKISCRAWCAG